QLVSRRVDVGGGFTLAEQGPLSLRPFGPTGYGTGSVFGTAHIGTPGRNQYEPWGKVNGVGLSLYLQAGLLTGQGPLVTTPGPNPATLGTGGGANPYGGALGALSVKAGDFQFDASAQVQYARYGAFRAPGQGANVSNVGSGMLDLNLAGSIGPVNINGEIAGWYMRGTPLSGGGAWSAYDFKLGLGVGVMYQPGPFGIGINVLASHEFLANVGVNAPVGFQALPTIVSAW